MTHHTQSHIHIMPDLETLGTSPSSPIIAIGATDGDYNWGFFYGKIALTSTVGELDKNTVAWWLSQSKEAIDETFTGANTLSLREMLKAFTWWFNAAITGPEGEVLPYTIWGNAASFDLVLLRESYKAVGLVAPWDFRKEGCYRTLKNQFPEVAFNPVGIKHCALDDALNQHEHLLRILGHIDNMRTYFSNGDQLI